MSERFLLPGFVRPLLRGLVKLGFSEHAFLERTGVTGDELRIPIAQAGIALAELAEKSDTPHLALEITKAMPAGTLGSIDYFWSASPTLLEGMLRAAKFMGEMTEGLRLELQPEGALARLVQTPFMDDHPPMLNEITTAITALRVRHVLGQELAFSSVRFTHVPVGGPGVSTQAYDDFFGTKVQFEAPVSDFAFPLELLQQKLLTADPELVQMLRARQRPPPTRPPPPMDLLVRANQSILASLERDEPPTIITLARDLDTSTRSLQRKLGERKTTFSDVFDDVRRELATKLLAQENVLLADVASRLGFQNLNAFHRAFRRWTGASPRSFQKTLLGDDSPDE